MIGMWRRSGSSCELLDQLVAGEHRHERVGDDEVGHGRPDELHALGAVAGHEHREAGVLQPERHQPLHGRFVLHVDDGLRGLCAHERPVCPTPRGRERQESGRSGTEARRVMPARRRACSSPWSARLAAGGRRGGARHRRRRTSRRWCRHDHHDDHHRRPSTARPRRQPSGSDFSEGASQAPAGAKDAQGDGTAAPAGGIVVPPEAQQIIDAVRRSGPSSNADLLARLDALRDLGHARGRGRSASGSAASRSPGRPATATTGSIPRYGPGFRFHLGTDVFAAYGTPVRAPVDGVARERERRPRWAHRQGRHARRHLLLPGAPVRPRRGLHQRHGRAHR